MAVRRGIELALPQQENPGYLSDESEFYGKSISSRRSTDKHEADQSGDEATVQELEDRAGSFNAAEWWENKDFSLTEIGNSGIETAKGKATAMLYNPYEGQSCGRQLGETVEEFLARLPPATTRVSDETPWIFIANPFCEAPSQEIEQNDKKKLGEEGPPAEDSRWAQFVVMGGKLLEELIGIRHGIEIKMAGRAKGQITKVVNIEKDKIVRMILDTAADLHCTSGKWMMFCPSHEVNAVWSVVARQTAEGNFGIAAKVAPSDGRCGERLICIYTKNFNDMKDVTRVIRKMKDLGLIESKKALYYKCDAYTYLGLNSGNEYNIRASLYNSTDILAGKVEKKDQKKLDGLFLQEDDLSGDERQLE